MKALLCREYGPVERLAVEDVPSPRPGHGDVVIEVKASALNFPDALMVQGLYQVKPPLPFSPGMELAGIVKEVGEDVQGVHQGERVIASPGRGGFAQECVVAADRVSPLPAGMDFETGSAFVLTYCTSLHALADCGRLQAGETLVVLGASGGVGSSAIEVGKVMGARVIAAASSAEKLEFCRKLGADETIDYSSSDLRQRILDLTAAKGADVVYDPVGGPHTEAALRAMAWRGRLLIIGFASGLIPQPKLNLALLKERSLVGVYWGDWTQRDPAGQRRNVELLARWFTEGKVKPAVTERVTLEEAPAAMRRLLQRNVKGKVVVVP
ncbi:MAG TPA: NADPH:quinone oxidoreductase family protein [Myxococcales bacterium]|jgi:NADPH2:quinone reductase|nr:NADPH:quinone oxidoreductase family protein [Myxococcales bacterium]